MSRKTIISLIDDIDGGNADETLSFGLDGVMYEIDLSSKHADKLRKALEEFTKHARRVGKGNVISISRGQSKFTAQQPKRDKDLNDLIRKWANDNGCQVAERGRIPQQVVTAYESNDPTMLPGYKAPQVEVKQVDLKMSEGGMAVKKVTPAQRGKGTTARPAAAKAAAAG